MTKLERIAAIIAEKTDVPLELAEAFCDLDDEQQADFFVHCASIMCSWKGGLFDGHAAMEWQADQISNHLKTCACSTEDARDLVVALAYRLAPND